MSHIKKTILPILLTGIWINTSETIRWFLIIESYWIKKYESMNLILPTGLTTNITWMIWGFLFAVVIFILSKKFSVLHTALLAWFMAFVMLWVVIWNVGILPTGMLWINAPLGFIEVYIGAWICKKVST